MAPLKRVSNAVSIEPSAFATLPPAQMDQLVSHNELLQQGLAELRLEKRGLEQRLASMERQTGALIAENIKLSGALIAATKRSQAAACGMRGQAAALMQVCGARPRHNHAPNRVSCS